MLIHLLHICYPLDMKYQYSVLRMIPTDSRNHIKNLRFEDNQKAVSNAHNAHQEVGER